MKHLSARSVCRVLLVYGLSLLSLFFAKYASSAPAAELSNDRGALKSPSPYDPYERSGKKDWYDRAYEQYEDGPYGYYDEHHFYEDFDLDYWEDERSDDKGDWYQERFHRYYRDGYYDESDPYLHRRGLRPVPPWNP